MLSHSTNGLMPPCQQHHAKLAITGQKNNHPKHATLQTSSRRKTTKAKKLAFKTLSHDETINPSEKWQKSLKTKKRGQRTQTTRTITNAKHKKIKKKENPDMRTTSQAG